MTLRVKEVLKAKGITATKLNELMKEANTPLSRVSIGAIINGASSPKVETLEAIAAAVGVDVRDFFTGDSQDIYVKVGDQYKPIGKLYRQ